MCLPCAISRNAESTRVDGKERKLLAQASRNGWFFVLDRATGQHILSSEFVKTNWSLGVDAKGHPIPNPATPDDPEHGYMARVAREVLPRVRARLGVRAT